MKFLSLSFWASLFPKLLTRGYWVTLNSKKGWTGSKGLEKGDPHVVPVAKLADRFVHRPVDSLAGIPPALPNGPGLRQERDPDGHLDIHGGGIVQVHGNYAYIGHMEAGAKGGTSIVDVSDPNRPDAGLAGFRPPGVHSHKVRVDDELQIMMVNYEKSGSPSPTQPLGLAIYDISNKTKPELLTALVGWRRGVHRMTYDRKLKYAYLGADVKGYNGAIVVVLDLHNPRAPTEVARWWLPGQGPGESFAYDPLWTGIAGDFRTHHPIVGADGNFYIGYWNGGFVIAKANWNNTRTKLLGFQKEPLVHVNWAMTIKSPGHTLLPVDHKIGGWDIAVLTDEDVDNNMDPQYQPFMWIAIVDKAKPDRWVLTPIANYRAEQPDYVTHSKDGERRFGAHQPYESVGPAICVCNLVRGRTPDRGRNNPFQPREVGQFVPGPAPGYELAATNDVFVRADRSPIDRWNGLEIVKYKAE